MNERPPIEPAVSTFDPEILWSLHRKKIVGGAVVVALLLLATAVYLGLRSIRDQQAATAYAKATSIEEWQSVIQQYPRSMAAGNSYLHIAAALAASAKYAEADKSYAEFGRVLPNHPFAVDGYVGQAQDAEALNQPEKALEIYRQVTSRFPKSYQAPMALYEQARLTKAKGQLKEARALFESIVQRYPTSVAASLATPEASRLNERLQNGEPPATPAASAPPSSAPAAANSPSPSATAGSLKPEN